MEMSTLFIILDTQDPNLNFLAKKTQHDFMMNSWLIFYPIESSQIFNSDERIVQYFQEEFKYIRGIHLNSKLYVAVLSDNLTIESQLSYCEIKLFEIYRRSEQSELISGKITSTTIENIADSRSNENFSNSYCDSWKEPNYCTNVSSDL